MTATSHTAAVSPLKLCLTSSSGGHYEQLLILTALNDDYDCFVVTEKTPYSNGPKGLRTYWLSQVNRSNPLFIFPLLKNLFFSSRVLRKEKPDIIISTGVLSTIPLCLLGKLRGSKLIYIESYAIVDSATATGKLLSRVADAFYVQWPEMLSVFPDARFVGGIY